MDGWGVATPRIGLAWPVRHGDRGLAWYGKARLRRRGRRGKAAEARVAGHNGPRHVIVMVRRVLARPAWQGRTRCGVHGFRMAWNVGHGRWVVVWRREGCWDMARAAWPAGR